jgi:hypothetical protein
LAFVVRQSFWHDARQPRRAVETGGAEDLEESVAARRRTTDNVAKLRDEPLTRRIEHVEDKMRISRCSVAAAALLAMAVCVVLSSRPVSAQTAKSQSASKADAPKASGDRRDLQGVWSFVTVTPLQRPKEFAEKDVLSSDEKAKLEEQAVRDQFVDRPPPPGETGAYNRFWIESGTKVVKTGRTSLIVDPPDGRLPPLTPRGKEREAALQSRAKLAAGPEDMTTWDRCLVGFNAGPPMIGGGYNANVQIFQTRDLVVLLNEMVHDARIIPTDGRPQKNIRQWKGESRGRWEGDTLVVETKNFRSEGTGTLSLRGLGLSVDENLRLTERFRRFDAETLLYEYTVDDPTVWTKPWTVSMTMEKSDQLLYEYACHEGNYAMKHMLSGARAQEGKGTKN